MNLYDKISVLGPSAQYDTCGPKDFGKTTDIPGVYHAKVGGNNVCRLFKVLQTNKCMHNCNYCAFRRDRSTQRAEVSPDEMAKAFDSAYSRRLVEGLFLSSGVDTHPDTTMSRLIDTAAILRSRYDYRGYLHLKLMPGISKPCIEEAVGVVDRLSLNIEAPTEEDLNVLSPTKRLKSGFFHTMSMVRNVLDKREAAGQKAPSLTTQFVVGAGDEKDRDIIGTTNFLYKNFGLKRVFYSAFRPVEGTPLEGRPAASLTREHRLYQSDFLMRFYRFLPRDIPLSDDGFLEESVDPKTLWARNHPEFFPVNLNTAGYLALLKVPGIGPVSAKKIIEMRQWRRFWDVVELKGQRVQVRKAAEFVCV